MRTEFGVALLSSGVYAAVASGTPENEPERDMLARIPWAEPRIVGDCAVIRDREGLDRVVHFSMHETEEEAKKVAEGVAYRISCVMEDRIAQDEISDFMKEDTGMCDVVPWRHECEPGLGKNSA